MTNNALIQAQKVFILFLVGILLLACSFFPAAISKATPAMVRTSAAPGAAESQSTVSAESRSTASAEIPTSAPDPLDWLLGLRSVKIDQTTIHPDGSTHSLSVEIDSAGNMLVKETHPIILDTKNLPKDVDIKQLDYEETLFVLAGKAYLMDSTDPAWKTSPVDDDFVQTLSDELHGADSPGLWLNILPDDSFQAAGTENVGGFTATKYIVNGKVNSHIISGSIWLETKTKALIKADLSVPAALIDHSDQSGGLKITLDAQQATVDPVKLPDNPSAEITPTKAP